MGKKYLKCVLSYIVFILIWKFLINNIYVCEWNIIEIGRRENILLMFNVLDNKFYINSYVYL